MLGLMGQLGKFIAGNDTNESYSGGMIFSPPSDFIQQEEESVLLDLGGDAYDDRDAYDAYDASYANYNEEYTNHYYNEDGREDDDEDDIESGNVFHLKSPEEARQFVVEKYYEYISSHFGRPPVYDTDLLCNMTLTETDTWHIPASHIFVEILIGHSRQNNGDGNPLMFEENQHEQFFIYEYEDVIDLARDMTIWFKECGKELQPTLRLKTVDELLIEDQSLVQHEDIPTNDTTNQ